MQTYLLAGITEIRVVTGYDCEQVRTVLEKLPVQEVYNPRHTEGMYASVQCGIASCPPGISGYFIHPADVPLVSPETIRRLSAETNRIGERIICPVFQGRRGHPLLVGASFRTAILDQDRSLGLKGLLNEHGDAIVPVIVDDPGILMNMNTPADYRDMISRIQRPSEDFRRGNE